MIIIFVLIDQIIKINITEKLRYSTMNIIEGILNFTYVENTGGAYGIGNNSVSTIIIVNIIIITILGKFVLAKKDEIHITILFSFGLVLAGGTANLIDRIFRGFVVDYIDFNPLIKYPVFNFADICVVLGCIIIGINLFVETIKNKK